VFEIRSKIRHRLARWWPIIASNCKGVLGSEDDDDVDDDDGGGGDDDDNDVDDDGGGSGGGDAVVEASILQFIHV